MTDLERLPPGVDPTVPSSARVYDYLLGGKDNLAVDREVADKLLAVAPDTRLVARASRHFQIEAVRHLAGQGIRQFLDLGTGIPTSPSIHETVRQVHPACRVVYVDNDPVVRLHAQVLLADAPGLAALQADLRRPADILDSPEVTELIDFDRPVCVLMVGVLHYVMDDEDPAGIVAAFRDRMAPGSHLVLSHALAESDAQAVGRLRASTDGTSAQAGFRTREEVLSLFEGFELIGPGLVPVHEWRLGPDDQEVPLIDGVPRLLFAAGVGRVKA
ncbi:SAM-dependent methyltransferase [Nonomuraea wenchangensis]